MYVSVLSLTPCSRPQAGRRTVSRPAEHKLRLNFGLASIFTAGCRLNGFRLKIGLFSAYLSVIVDGHPKQRKPPETHFPESQTSTTNKRIYMKPSLRVKITIIFASIQLPFTL